MGFAAFFVLFIVPLGVCAYVILTRRTYKKIDLFEDDIPMSIDALSIDICDIEFHFGGVSPEGDVDPPNPRPPGIPPDDFDTIDGVPV
jgi:hypothetical protein